MKTSTKILLASGFAGVAGLLLSSVLAAAVAFGLSCMMLFRCEDF